MWCLCHSRPPYPEPLRREAVELVRTRGKSIKEIAADLGVTERSLRSWVKQYESMLGSGQGSAAMSVRSSGGCGENRVLREEREILRKAAAFFAGRATTSGSRLPVHRCGEDHHEVAVMCRVLGVSRAGFYVWGASGALGPGADRRVADRERSGRSTRRHRARYGSRRIYAELRLEHGIRVGKKRVERLMAITACRAAPRGAEPARGCESRACGLRRTCLGARLPGEALVAQLVLR
jgi:transposase